MKGPIYGVELFDSLPIGTGCMVQAMPGAAELESSRRNGDRIAAGFEVLTSHYRDAIGKLEGLKLFAGFVVTAFDNGDSESLADEIDNLRKAIGK